ncbi:MAG TPA: peroxiredoxin [Acidobacteriaceae bacterium]|jgi:peroxiredoxin Q/BCP|nr:peroxiredoxin [Acidobacteriaceae bacterium]
MNMTRVSIAAAAALVLLAVGFFGIRAMAASDSIPTVGQMAPNFTLPSQEGTNISLNQYHGKWVVLYFYPKDQTSGCTIEAKHFQRDMSKYDAANSVVLGVSVDTVKSHQAFCAVDGLHFKLLADPDTSVVAQYGSLGNYMGFKIAKRNTFLINPEGKIVKEWIGVDPNHHSTEVLAAIHELQKQS